MVTYAIDWVVKASKLCNLRCRYCYEWEELADPERMSLALWGRVLTAIREHLEAAEAWDFHGGAAQADIIWHGGEPLLLPDSYFDAVLSLQREIFPDAWLASGRVRNTMQTNLYKAPEAKLRRLKRAGFNLGVSYDGVPGARLTAGGRETEGRVMENIARARDLGFDPGAIVVVAGHTAPKLVELYEHLRGRVREMKLLPLFNGPDSRPVEACDADDAAIVAAMGDLFDHWLDEGCSMSVDPLERYFAAVLNTRLGLKVRPYDRRRFGDNVMIVNIDGTLRTPGANQAEPPMGDLKTQSIGEILTGAPYAASLDYDAAARDGVCGACRYRGGCNTYPIFANDDGAIARGTCPVARPLMERMDRRLDAIGYDDAALTELFEAVAGGQAPV
jgi:uncharacterized protein